MSIHLDLQGALSELNDMMVLPDGTSPSFLWRGATVPCIPNMLEAGNVVVQGGREDTVVCSLNVSAIQFLTIDSSLITIDSDLFTTDDVTPTPVAGKNLIFRGKTYKIFSAALDGSSAYFKIVLTSSKNPR